MAFESIVVADSDDLSRIGLKAILADSEFRDSVAEATNFRDLVEVLEGDACRILIVDVRLAGLVGSEGLSSLSRRFPGIRTCVLLGSVTREIVSQYLSIGVMGCVEKSRTAVEIVDALRAISDNRPYLSKLDGDDRPSRMPTTTPGSLTHRQQKVLAVMATGKSNKEIARELGICEGTVKVHVNAAYRALGVHNRVAAVAVLRELAERGQQENGKPIRIVVGSN